MNRDEARAADGAAARPEEIGSMHGTRKHQHKMGGMGWLILLIGLFLAACAPSNSPAPPATLQAVLASSAIWDGVDPSAVVLLQEQPLGQGQLMLYQWQNEAGEDCLTAAYLFELNSQWQPHDTFHAPCHGEATFMAAHSGNSTAEAPYGPARHSVAYGVSQMGHAVRVVWADGQVSYVPLTKGSFLAARNGRISVERVELVDNTNTILMVEEWDEATLN